MAGMLFAPRRGRRRVLVVARIAGAEAHCRRADDATRRVTVRADRLLAVDGDGRPLHYRFAGFSKRQSGYRTTARVVAVRDGRALLCLPEWHPLRPAWLFADLLPGDARVGDWLSLRAHLDAARSAHLRPHKLSLCEPPEPALAERALVEPPDDERPARVPPDGPGCGDIVTYASERLLARLGSPATDRWDRSVFVHRNRLPASLSEGLDPTELQAGAGIWLAHDGRVRERCVLAATRNNPNGTLLLLDDDPVPVDDGPECRPFTGWRWRWWPLV